MRFRRNLSGIIFVACLLVSSGLGLSPSAQAKNSLVNELPITERNIFILDVSGSTNSTQQWKNSLRPSIINKLVQPFGFPVRKGFSKKGSPVDVLVGVINSQSIDAPVFPIVTLSDSLAMWGLIDKIGESPTSARLSAIVEDVFGGQGAWTQNAKIFTSSKLVSPSRKNCEQSVLKSFRTASYMNDLNSVSKNSAAGTICGLTISISNRIIAADKYFEESECTDQHSCSDIVGAILRTTYSAQDLSTLSPKSKMCIAIASDMLNNYPGISSMSSLNSRRVALESSSQGEAKSEGKTAAEETGIKFPAGMAVRVSVLGQGTGSKPIPLDRNGILSAYWSGFWESAGIKVSNQTRSFDRACS